MEMMMGTAVLFLILMGAGYLYLDTKVLKLPRVSRWHLPIGLLVITIWLGGIWFVLIPISKSFPYHEAHREFTLAPAMKSENSEYYLITGTPTGDGCTNSIVAFHDNNTVRSMNICATITVAPGATPTLHKTTDVLDDGWPFYLGLRFINDRYTVELPAENIVVSTLALRVY